MVYRTEAHDTDLSRKGRESDPNRGARWKLWRRRPRHIAEANREQEPLPRREQKGARPLLHPIHLYSAGYLGTKREPMTWMGCPTCGYRTLWSPYEPAATCDGRWAGPHDPALTEPMDVARAAGATAEACDYDNDLIARTRS